MKIDQSLGDLVDCPDTAIRMAFLMVTHDTANALLDEVAIENSLPVP